jgi:uncharacterized protein HemX
MAKKLGKLLLFIAGAASIAAAVYYFLKKQDSKECAKQVEDADDLEEESKTSRTYVPLNNGVAEASVKTEDSVNAGSTSDSGFTPLAAQVEKAASEDVEEFFDEDDTVTESESLAG